MKKKKQIDESVSRHMSFLRRNLQVDAEFRRLYQQEGIIFDVTELIAKFMEEESMGYRELADRLNVNRSDIVHILDGSKEMTLRQVADVFTALGVELVVGCKKIE